MRSHVKSKSVGRGSSGGTFATTSAVVGLALFGTAAAFIMGAQAGAALNGRVMQISVAKVPMPPMANTVNSPVNTHVR